jgi:hypothetical protein
VSPKFAFSEAGTQVSAVTMSPASQRATAPPHLPLFIKGPLKEGWEFCFCLSMFILGFWAFGLLGFLLGFGLFAFGGFLP